MKLSFFILAVSYGTLPRARAEIDFVHQIVPILRQHCSECHIAAARKGGFSLNDRETLFEGGESGKAIVPGNASASYLYELVTSQDPDSRMPPTGPGLSQQEIELVKGWIDEGARWDAGFSFSQPAYEPPVAPRRPELPEPTNSRQHPIDCIIDHYLVSNQTELPAAIDERTFLRRSSFDIVGLAPLPSDVEKHLASSSPNKRAEWIAKLLADDIGYADHWLTFWNDLLRNDYAGTGFITGGRKQVSSWLYDSLLNNKPYDQFVRELISPPNDESRGFIDGIQWRGDVSAGQTIEIQFSQSISQSFLGINMKCASCHDSFIDRWKLHEAYGLAAIYANRQLDVFRCDKATGQKAKASWIFPELGNVDPEAKPQERLRQLSELMVAPENGRFARTIVNRIWHRLMGRGIVHPIDSMQSRPWNEDLLDYLATYFVDQRHDLRKLIEHIVTSQAYQSRCVSLQSSDDVKEFRYAGPQAKRLTAEQFVDAVWSVTQAGPLAYDAPIVRSLAKDINLNHSKPSASWLWREPDTGKDSDDATSTLLFQKSFKIDDAIALAGVVINVNREYTLFVNNRVVGTDSDARALEMYPVHHLLKKGNNTITVVANAPINDPSKGFVWLEASVTTVSGNQVRIPSDKTWLYTDQAPSLKEKRLKAVDAKTMKPAVVLKSTAAMKALVNKQAPLLLARSQSKDRRMVRASLMKSDFLMRSLGRPNRDQIVSMRPDTVTTLEAMDLSNATSLATLLGEGSKQFVRSEVSDEQIVSELYERILTRRPTDAELTIAVEFLQGPHRAEGVEDLLWSLLVSPEFQYVR